MSLTLLLPNRYLLDKNVGLSTVGDKIEEMSKQPTIEVLKWILLQKLQKQTGPNRRLFLLLGRTSSGKSTLAVEQIYRMMQRGCLLCTQPRIILCKDHVLTAFPQYYPDIKVGVDIGYSTGAGKIIPTAKKSILYCTTRILYNALSTALENDDNAKTFSYRYPIVIVDEAHEQSCETGFTLLAVREYLSKYSDREWCSLVIIMSATLDMDTFAKYFNVDRKDPLNIGEVSGAGSFPVKEVYLENTNVSFRRELVNVVNRAIQDTRQSDYTFKGHKCNDVLVLLPGKRDMDDLARMLEGVNVSNMMLNEVDKHNLILIPYLSADVQNNTIAHQIFSRPPTNNNQVRVFMSTTMLEAGATMMWLCACVDGGWAKMELAYPLCDKKKLITLPISKSAHIQRKGRVGRVGPGIFYGMYHQSTVNKLSLNYPPPTINSVDVCDYYVSMLKTREYNMRNLTANIPLTIKYPNLPIVLMSLYATSEPFDPVRDNDLIYPVSNDVNINTMRKLIINGFMTVNGRFTGSTVDGAFGVMSTVNNLVLMNANTFDILFITELYKRDFQKRALTLKPMVYPSIECDVDLQFDPLGKIDFKPSVYEAVSTAINSMPDEVNHSKSIFTNRCKWLDTL